MPDNTQPDSRLYRQVMGLFATGVTVLTTYNDQGDPVGMTANAVSSVSLDPLLALVCVWKQASIMPHLQVNTRFALNILSRQQEALSRYFANQWHDDLPPAYHIEEWNGTPYLRDSIGALALERYDLLEGGDHWILLGKVMALRRQQNPPPPLLFYAGQYRELKP